MCGIGGAFFVRDGELVRRFAAHASECLAHRGPDDRDVLVRPAGTLVHRRLSILDPSPAGRQPFVSASGRQWLIHNGEIYNYLELREELIGLGHAFRTDTDTEVILAAWAAWGEAAVERFNGIWAFALWDEQRSRLWLSRDRLGVKPLYYAEVAGGILFASEIKALLPSLSSRAPNPGALRDYLWHGLADHADATFFNAIRIVPPATNLLVSESDRRAHRYWTIDGLSDDADPRPQPGDEALVERFAALLREAIGLQLRSDVALGTCLSGGLDSATIVAISSALVSERLGPHESAPRIAVTAGFPGSPDDETSLAALSADAAGLEHLVVRPTPGALIETLGVLIREHDEPFVSSSILAQRAVMAAAGEAGVKVMLDGQGADELLGGYSHHRYPWLLGLVRSRPAALPGALRSLRRFGIGPGVALRQAALAALQLGRTGIAPVGRASRPPAWLGAELRAVPGLHLRGGDDRLVGGTPLARHLRRATLSTSLPALLRYEDRSSMRFSIEARVPFLDHRVVEAAMELPDRLKIADGWTKVVLRKAGRGRLPDAVRTEARKIGFATPQAEWLLSGREAIRAALVAGRASREGLITPRDLEAPLAGLDAGGDSAVWRALSVELWLDAYG